MDEALLPADERAVLEFLSAMAGKRNEFISREFDLVAMLSDCSLGRFRLLAKRLTARGLIERQKLHWIGTRWIILAKVSDDAPKESALFLIPQCRPNWPSVVTYAKEAALLNALPLVSGDKHETKPPVLHFPKGKAFEFTWTVVDADRNPAKDCKVRASLLYGRSRYGVGGTPVAGFDDVRLQHTGEGNYVARVTITAAVGTNYVTTVEARRGGKRFGWWETPSAVY